MSENPKADYWYEECYASDQIIAEIKGVLMRINVFDGPAQYQTSINEIFKIIQDGQAKQTRRRKEHAEALLNSGKVIEK